MRYRHPFCQPALQHQEADQQGGEGDDPGNGVGDIQAGQGVVALHLENGEDPAQSHPANAQHRHQHRHQRGAHPAEHTGHHVHQPAQEIGQAHVAHTGDAVGDGVHLGSQVDGKKLFRKQITAAPEDDAHRSHGKQADPQDLPEVFVFPRPHVLPHEVHGGLVEGVHGNVDEALDVPRGGVTGHGHGAESVDGGLDDHVGDGEQGALDPRRQADAGDLPKSGRVDLQLPPHQTAGVLTAGQLDQYQHAGEQLGKGCGQGNPRHAHVELGDENKVQHHVHHTRDGKEDQRAFGVPRRTEDGGTEVVKQHGDDPREIDPHIQRGKVDHVVGGVHQMEQGRGKAHPHEGQQDPAEEGRRERGMHRAVNHVVVPRADTLGNQNAGAHGKAHEQVHDQVDQSAGSTYRRHGFLACVAANHHQVCGVEQQLQKTRCNDGQGVKHYFLKKRPCAKIGRAANRGSLCAHIAVSFFAFFPSTLHLFPRNCNPVFALFCVTSFFPGKKQKNFHFALDI